MGSGAPTSRSSSDLSGTTRVKLAPIGTGRRTLMFSNNSDTHWRRKATYLHFNNEGPILTALILVVWYHFGTVLMHYRVSKCYM